MSQESITVIVNDLQNHVQGITEEVDRIANLCPVAIEHQENESFNRRTHVTLLKFLGDLIAIEERLYSYAEGLRVTAGVSASDGKSTDLRFDSSRETNRGD